MEMDMKNDKFETSDLALATFLFCSGINLLEIDRQNPRRCIFIFDSPKPELISEWQGGTAVVNGMAFFNAYCELKGRVFRGDRNG